MKYYIIAGEASGDLHAANMMKALKKSDSKAEFRFWGGDLMQNVDGKLNTTSGALEISITADKFYIDATTP